MAEGIKIRELDSTTTVSDDDVLVIDSKNLTDSSTSLTRQIKYSDFLKEVNDDLEIPEPPDNNVADRGDYYMLKQGETVELKVTVGAKSSFNNYITENPTDKCFFLDGEEAPVVLMTPGRTYRFDTSEVPDDTKFQLFGDEDCSLAFVSGFFGYTEGDGFVEYKVHQNNYRFYYGSLGVKMGGLMVNLNSSESPFPGNVLDVIREDISRNENNLLNNVARIDAVVNNLTSQYNTVTNQYVQLNDLIGNNDEDIEDNDNDIDSMKAEILELRQTIELQRQSIESLQQAISDMGLVLETE